MMDLKVMVFCALISWPATVNGVMVEVGCDKYDMVCESRDALTQKSDNYLGVCNNVKNPLWGSSKTSLRRLLPAIYEDKFSDPIGWNDPTVIPGALQVSSRVLTAGCYPTPASDYTQMVVLWGNYHAYDLGRVGEVPYPDCVGVCEYQHPCYPVLLSTSLHSTVNKKGDVNVAISSDGCIKLRRSAVPCESAKRTVRDQKNEKTAYLDASNLYGSTYNYAYNLRELVPDYGLLLTDTEVTGSTGKPLPQYGVFCGSPAKGADCFLTGDKRVNRQLPLASMEIIWLREHNRIAQSLRAIFPDYDGESIYWEARKLVVAMHQHITEEEYWPKLIGKSGVERIGKYTGYDDTVDATLYNEFYAGAYRFASSNLPIVYRLKDDLTPIAEGNIQLNETWYKTYLIVQEGGIDPVLRGAMAVGNKQMKASEVDTSELTDELYALVYEQNVNKTAKQIQRARDHGLASYNDYRELCGLPRANDFKTGLANEITNNDVLTKLESVYGDVDKVDLFVAGMLEDPAPGAIVGPTFSCIIEKQFKATRDGDRFYYKNHGVFTKKQLVALKSNVSLASVICTNADSITRVPADVFTVTDLADWKSCDSLPTLDLDSFYSRHAVQEEHCTDKPLLQFTFNGDYEDCGCVSTWGTPTGNTQLLSGTDLTTACPKHDSCDQNAPDCAVCFSEPGGSVELENLKHWFHTGEVAAFSLSMWFHHLPGASHMGLFSNGQCEQDATTREFNFDFDFDSRRKRGYDADAWGHAGITFENDAMYSYLNGQLVNTVEIGGAITFSEEGGATIGKSYVDCIEQYFIGCIDDFRVYNKSVSAREYDAIYKEGRK